MKILELPQLENIDSMKRRDITMILSHVVEKLPSDACRTRLEIALAKGRNVPKLIEWLERCDKFSEYDTQESNGVKLGDELGYVETKRTRGGYSMTQKYGRVFVIKGNVAMLCVRKGLKRIQLEKETLTNG